MNQSVAEPATSDVYVARQPILSTTRKLYAYELLYRSSNTNAFDGADATTATSRLITNSFLTIGIDRLVGEHRAFINFGREMLLGGYAQMLPKNSVVIEVLEDVEPDEPVIEACRDLKRKGYLLALDDFVCVDGYADLLELADIVKVDCRLTTPGQKREIARSLQALGVRLLAEKVETHEEFTEARDLGYSLFQGYFFSKPHIVVARELRGFKLNYLRILKEVSNPELDFARIEAVIKAEVSFVHKLLKYANSANFGWKHKVESIRHALALLGEEEVRKWISLATFAGLARDKPQQLVVDAVFRGRFAESLSRRLGLVSRSTDFFLLGMYSLIDALLDRPLEEIIEEVHLAGDVRDVLLGKPVTTRGLGESLALAKAYEQADWQAIEEITARLRLPGDVVSEAYVEAAEWADRIFSG